MCPSLFHILYSTENTQKKPDVILRPSSIETALIQSGTKLPTIPQVTSFTSALFLAAVGQVTGLTLLATVGPVSLHRLPQFVREVIWKESLVIFANVPCSALHGKNLKWDCTEHYLLESLVAWNLGLAAYKPKPLTYWLHHCLVTLLVVVYVVQFSPSDYHIMFGCIHVNVKTPAVV